MNELITWFIVVFFTYILFGLKKKQKQFENDLLELSRRISNILSNVKDIETRHRHRERHRHSWVRNRRDRDRSRSRSREKYGKYPDKNLYGKEPQTGCFSTNSIERIDYQDKNIDEYYCP
jgi:biopolymer transport protein ExbB/TolQ